MVDRQEEEALVQEVTWFRGVSGEEGKEILFVVFFIF